jgi:hypothetical protein
MQYKQDNYRLIKYIQLQKLELKIIIYDHQFYNFSNITYIVQSIYLCDCAIRLVYPVIPLVTEAQR